MFYRLMRALMFQLDAEKAHYIGLQGLSLLERSGLTSLLYPQVSTSPIDVMGLTFSNAVGLAAGLDKNGDYIKAMASLGFGFVEIGTVTPKPQKGKAKLRLFRLPEVEAVINRMGFNNLGVDHLIEQVREVNSTAVLGINIGKNFDTSVEESVNDYLIGLSKVYAYADYVTINISSPNTQGLRALQFGEPLNKLLQQLSQEREKLQQQYQRYVPMVVKVSPDLEDDEVEQLAQSLVQYEIDAVIANNTTISRDGVRGLKNWDEAGGLSGRPVFSKSTDIVRKFSEALPSSFPIIAAGGIMSGDDAQLKIDAGASLVQIYSGLIYQGPGLVSDIVDTIGKKN